MAVALRNPAERQFGCHLIEHALLRRPVGTGEADQTRRLCRAGAQYIDPNPALLEIKLSRCRFPCNRQRKPKGGAAWLVRLCP